MMALICMREITIYEESVDLVSFESERVRPPASQQAYLTFLDVSF